MDVAVVEVDQDGRTLNQWTAWTGRQADNSLQPEQHCSRGTGVALARQVVGHRLVAQGRPGSGVLPRCSLAA
nr:unnamed protein product [Digitaria exilis]